MFSFCRICPAGTLQASLPSAIAEGFSTIQLATVIRWLTLVAILVLAVTSLRSFCRVLCPIAAILAPLNYVSLWAIKAPAVDCVDCKTCDRSCSMEIRPSDRIDKGIPANRHAECIVCHECQSACPQKTQDRRPSPAADLRSMG